MKKSQLLITAFTSLTLSLPLISEAASSVTISFSPFDEVSGGVFDTLPDTYVALFGGTNTGATHIIIDGVQSFSEDSAMVAGNVHVVNMETEEELAEGAIAFDITSTSGEETSPIVGIIPLAGGFDNESVTVVTPDSALGSRVPVTSGSITSGTFSFSIDGTESTLCYTSPWEGEMEIEAPFWINYDSGSIKFTEGFLEPVGEGMIGGFFVSDFSSETNADNVYMTVITMDQDSDSDGYPDLVDSDTYWYSEADYEESTGWMWNWLGNFTFYYAPRSDDAWNDFDASSHSNIWHNQHGYMYSETLFDSETSTKWAIFYDYNLGWLATNSANYPYMYAYGPTVDGQSHDATWLYFVPESGYDAERLFYAYNGDMSTSTSFTGGDAGYTGWWGIHGAK